MTSGQKRALTKSSMTWQTRVVSVSSMPTPSAIRPRTSHATCTRTRSLSRSPLGTPTSIWRSCGVRSGAPEASLGGDAMTVSSEVLTRSSKPSKSARTGANNSTNMSTRYIRHALTQADVIDFVSSNLMGSEIPKSMRPKRCCLQMVICSHCRKRTKFFWLCEKHNKAVQEVGWPRLKPQIDRLDCFMEWHSQDRCSHCTKPETQSSYVSPYVPRSTPPWKAWERPPTPQSLWHLDPLAFRCP